MKGVSLKASIFFNLARRNYEFITTKDTKATCLDGRGSKSSGYSKEREMQRVEFKRERPKYRR